MSDELYTFGTDEIEKKLMAIASAEEKKQELTRLGLIAAKEIAAKTPVDSSRLHTALEDFKSSVKIQDESTAFVGTNVEYAEAAEYGHEQKAMFLDAKHLSPKDRDKFAGAIVNGKNVSGIPLKAKWVEGIHMFQKGINAAGPKLDSDIKSWLQKLADRFNG